MLEAAFSIAVLFYLLRVKEDLTPDFLHFVFSLGEDATHKIWIFSLWLAYKCFLNVGATDLALPENLRLALIYMQGFLGLLLAEQASLKTLAIFTALFLILTLRLRFPSVLNMPLVFFVGIYLSQNFLVNSLDYMLYRRHRDDLGYYHDSDFLKSFSYKSH